MLWIIWRAMVVSVLVDALVVLLLVPARPTASASSGLGLWLGFEAAGTFWAAIVIRKMRVTDPIRSGALDPGSPAGQAAIRKISIVCWALAESIAIFGLIIGFLKHDRSAALAFIGGALVLDLFLAPR